MTKDELLKPITGETRKGQTASFDVERFLFATRGAIEAAIHKVTDLVPFCIRCGETATLTVSLLGVEVALRQRKVTVGEPSERDSGLQFDTKDWAQFRDYGGDSLCPECAEQTRKARGPAVETHDPHDDPPF